jgi:succinate dehydrogenase/fumarate reductase cytochrome b subunit
LIGKYYVFSIFVNVCFTLKNGEQFLENKFSQNKFYKNIKHVVFLYVLLWTLRHFDYGLWQCIVTFSLSYEVVNTLIKKKWWVVFVVVANGHGMVVVVRQLW